jgi:hypothetical protein
MKAISIKQPWAQLIARGEKTIELRTWATNHRGPLLIVSSLAPDAGIMKKTGKTNAAGAHWLTDKHARNGLSGFYQLGAAICMVNLVSCEPYDGKKHGPGALADFDAAGLFAWQLSTPQPVKPAQIKGKLNFYYVDDHLIR